MNGPAWAALRAQEVTMFYGHRRKGLYTRKAQLAYLGSPYKNGGAPRHAKRYRPHSG
jgi:hypothetical protein